MIREFSPQALQTFPGLYQEQLAIYLCHALEVVRVRLIEVAVKEVCLTITASSENCQYRTRHTPGKIVAKLLHNLRDQALIESREQNLLSPRGAASDL
jgi:hypothetical protein